jgi:hypothetical protein
LRTTFSFPLDLAFGSLGGAVLARLLDLVNNLPVIEGRAYSPPNDIGFSGERRKVAAGASRWF